MPLARIGAGHHRASLTSRVIAACLAALLAACATSPVSNTSNTSDTSNIASPDVNQAATDSRQRSTDASSPGAGGKTQQSFANLVEQQNRLYRVAAPLLTNNTELCRRNARNLLGFVAKTRYSFSPEYVQVAQNTLGLDDRLRVTGVLPASGAARAGLQVGDLLLSVDGKPLPSGENAERDAAAMLAPMMTGRSSVKLGIQRQGVERTLTVPLTYACAFGIELGNVDLPTAYSDGNRSLITRGLLQKLGSDNELAFIVAEEMAHNILAHPIQLRTSAATRTLIDKLMRPRPEALAPGSAAAAGIKPMPPQLDAVSDKLALYLLARAGYALDGAVPFWRRMAREMPAQQQDSYLTLHPVTDMRLTTMEKTIADIKAKQAAKKPVMP